jgi:hypothetical protein
MRLPFDDQSALTSPAMTTLLRATRVVLATAIIVATAFWGLVITFSDYPSHWSMTRWILYIVASHLPGAFLAGLLLRRWWIAMLSGLSAVLLLTAGGLIAPALLLVGSIAAAAYGGARASSLVSRTLAASRSPSTQPESEHRDH